MKVCLLNFVDESKCFEYLRLLRWSEGVNCPHCDSIEISKNGFDHTQVDKQRYKCNTCRKGFDDLSGTIFSGSNKRLKVWLLVLYFMGLNLSNRQIAEELEPVVSSVQLLVLFDTLKYLAKGGRIGKAKSLLGSVLNVKPLLTIKDGEFVPVSQVRSRAKGI
ncbi:MAG: hypothetical protein GY705_02370, partial [Bacteroidetes bacterium]|nr:hypothetical protein [Bacteroidota bacterium]